MDEYLHQISPYNLWGDNDLPTGFRRKEYTDKLTKYVGNNLIKVLTGQRRVGKSYIMRQVATTLMDRGVSRKNILFINKELSVFDFIQTSEDLDNLVKVYKRDIAEKGRIYIFIDEVQEIANWEKIVNSLAQDYTQEIEVFISGSNSRLLSGELSTLISGRYIEIRIYPFSYGEYIEVHNKPKGRESFLSYMNDGGLPELINLNDKEVRTRYIEGLRDSIMLKDIVRRHTIKYVGLLEALFDFLINNSSCLISISGIMKYLKGRGSKVSYDTIASYMSYMQEAFLIHKVERYNIAGKELLGGSFKVYPNDQSYHNYLYPTVRYGKGYLLEGVVYMELIRKGYKVETGVTRTGEIDFIATMGARKLYIQVSYILESRETMEREYGVFENLKGEGEKILVTMDDEIFPVRDGVRHIQVWDLADNL